MLRQQLTGNPTDMSGRLVIEAPAPELFTLQELAAELDARDYIITDGLITVVPPVEQPPPPDQ